MKRCGTFADHLHRWTPLSSDARFEFCACGASRRADRLSDNPCVQWWGRGPAGKTCGECAHLVHHRQAAVWFKCHLRNDLTHGANTDQRKRWEACARFEQQGATHEQARALLASAGESERSGGDGA